jgi:tryptophan synthase alpha chain
MSRIAERFVQLRKMNRAGFIPFVTGGDPDIATSVSILTALPSIGADLIEIGIPFSDPMADGPTNQASYLRALHSGATLPKILEMVRKFRKSDASTPIVLMGAYNPIHAFGTARFARSASEAGVDGVLVVDLPVEEDEVLRLPAAEHGMDIIRLLAPTTDDVRLKTVVKNAHGYVYYASIAGVTGTKSFVEEEVHAAVDRVKRATQLPCAVGFGVRTPEQAASIARFADGVVVGSSIVARIEKAAAEGKNPKAIVSEVLEFCALLAKSVHAARAVAVVE